MENRRYPRENIADRSQLSAKLVLNGGSLLESSTTHSIEIGAKPLNISRGGICLNLKLDVPWVTLNPQSKVSLLLSFGKQVWLLPATVVRHEKEGRTLALEFADPMKSIAPFLAPVELH